MRLQQQTGIVTNAFMLLVKLHTLRVSESQVQQLIDHPDSPYIRGIGFLYIRYTADPKTMWDWMGPYLSDPEEFRLERTHKT
jgi:pre-mRNA-splicing factor 38B